MRDNRAIGLKTAATNRRRHGRDFYSKIGKLSYKKRKTHYHYFAELSKNDPEALKELGRRTGKGYARNNKENRHA